jgi:DNA-binding NtrC family response regulator
MGAPRLRLAWVDANGQNRSVEVGGRLRLGRAPECELVLDEEGVSRVHCEVRPAGDGLELVDVKSTNGTFVNGSRVQQAQLRKGDLITLGRVRLLVEEAGEMAETRTSLTGDDVELALDAGAAYPPAGLSVESGRRHLESLYGILRTIGESPSAAEMFRGILRTILDTLPFDFGHVLIGPRPGATDGELVAIASHGKGGTPPAPSRTVIRRVLKSGQAVLANDVFADASLAAAKSIAAARTLRIACAPIPLRGRSGVLYVAASGLAAPVQAADVAFLNAAARQIGLAADALTERELLARENEHLKRAAPSHRLVGGSETMRKLRELVEKAAATDATVLIVGESGTGKELVARGVHEGSARAAKPFVALNCGALPGNVVQSELFGHEKGAFTGAAARRIGLVELAHGGTLFLDEVGELPLDVQAMLLRLLEEKRFFRVGGQEEVRADVRFVAATHRDLERAVRDGTFRHDLFFRLRVVEIRTPALRDHPEDLDEIAACVVDELARTSGRVARKLAPDAAELLRKHSWPGNVRELRNALERGLLLTPGPEIGAADLGVIPRLTGVGTATGTPRLVALEQVEREHILHVLQATGWHKTRAAEILGMARVTLYEKIRAFDLEPES